MSISDRIEGIREAPVRTVDKIAAINRSKYLDRWMERMAELGRPCRSALDIDYSDPQIHLEWLMCDPSVIVAVQSKRLRRNFVKTLTPAEREYFESDPKAMREFIKSQKLTDAMKGLGRRK